MRAVEEMSDDEVLLEAGSLGPGMIGQELFDRAEWIRANNPGGTYGPALLGVAHVPSDPVGLPKTKRRAK